MARTIAAAAAPGPVQVMASHLHAQGVVPLLVSWFALLAIGTVMVGSASIALGGDYLTKHLLFLAVSAVGTALVFAIPTAFWDKLYLLGWLVPVTLAVLVLIPFIGHEVNGASRWIRLGGFSLQAAEVAKFGLCLYLAGYLSRYHERLADDTNVLFVPLAMVAVVCGLLIAEPDLGSAVVIVAATVSLLFLAGAKLRYFALIIVVGAVALALLILLAPWRVQRMIAFLDPWSVAFGSGYQLTQALIAFGRGGLDGLGLGEGVQKLYYLPEAHNDFIFAVIAEELGGIGAICVVLLLAYAVLQVLLLARRNIAEGRMFAGFAAYFTGLVLGIQLLVNLGVNTGVLPTKGLTLPFLSYGGSSLMISCAMIGVVLRGSLERTGPAQKRPGRSKRRG